MKKTGMRQLCIFLLLVLALFMGGCAKEEWLEQVPKNFSVEDVQAKQEAIEMSLPDDRSALYYYNTLSEAEKMWYKDIKTALFLQTERQLSGDGLSMGLSENDIDRIFRYVMNDYPELFYVTGYQYIRHTKDDVVTALVFSGSYSVSGEEKEQKAARIEEEAQLLLDGIAQDASDYDKVKYVYETLIQNTEYVLDAPDNQNIYSVFVNQSSVCSGYAKATQYLLSRMGVECTFVQGMLDRGAHAWNLVKVDGEYYYVDTTWGDASYFADGQLMEDLNQTISYDYLCVTTEQMLRTHTFQEDVPLPQCTATEANYYVRENLIFTEFDRERITKIIQEAKAAGEECITLKCVNETCLEEIRRILLDEQLIFELLEYDRGPLAYTCNEEQLSLTIWIKQDDSGKNGNAVSEEL